MSPMLNLLDGFSEQNVREREKKEEKWHEWEDEKQENKNDRFKRI